MYKGYADENQRQPISTLTDMYSPRGEVDEFFAEDGPLSKVFEGYKPRPQQVQMARCIERAIKMSSTATIEAGTGTGKSFGYLVPAILSGKTVLVSTANTALQSQLEKKDLPKIAKAFKEYDGRIVRFTVLKGKSNYACLKKMRKGAPDALFDWSNEASCTGDIDSLSGDLHEIAKSFTSSSDECKPGQCDHKRDCFYYDAKSSAESSSVIVVNHALLCINQSLGGKVLPEYDVLIVDEAHQLAGYARNCLESSLSAKGLFQLVNRANSWLGVNTDKSKKRAEKVLDTVDFKSFAKPGQRIELNPAKAKKLRDVASQVKPLLGELYAKIQSHPDYTYQDDEGREVHDEAAIKILNRIDSVEETIFELGEIPEDRIAIIEQANKHRDPVVKICQVDIGEFVAGLCKRSRSNVFTSATLCTKKGPEGFDHFRFSHSIGGASNCLQVDSPFDFDKNIWYYLPRPSTLEHPKRIDGETRSDTTKRFSLAIVRHIRELVKATLGRALILHTSNDVLNFCYEYLEEELINDGFKVDRQGKKGKSELIKWFKSTPRSILFATASFWEGVDIPGQALSLVVIDKIPFPNNADPLEKAIQKKLGKSAFMKHCVPHAITHLKQGVGRLIRTETDKGLVAILDPRLRKSPYGNAILSQLPGMKWEGPKPVSFPASGLYKLEGWLNKEDRL